MWIECRVSDETPLNGGGGGCGVFSYSKSLLARNKLLNVTGDTEPEALENI